MSNDTLSSSLSTGITLTAASTYGSPFIIELTGIISPLSGYGIYSALAGASVLNFGTIGGLSGIALTSGGALTNTGPPARIDGNVVISGEAGTIANSGYIYAVTLDAGGMITNAATGSLAIRSSMRAKSPPPCIPTPSRSEVPPAEKLIIPASHPSSTLNSPPSAPAGRRRSSIAEPFTATSPASAMSPTEPSPSTIWVSNPPSRPVGASSQAAPRSTRIIIILPWPAAFISPTRAASSRKPMMPSSATNI